MLELYLLLILLFVLLVLINQFELRPKGATIFPEGTLFMFVTSATINAVPPDPAWIGTASWNVDVTAAESNLQQVVGVFNFLLRLDLVQPITVYGCRGHYYCSCEIRSSVYWQASRVYRQRLCPAFYWPSFTFGGYSIKVFQIPEDMYDEIA